MRSGAAGVFPWSRQPLSFLSPNQLQTKSTGDIYTACTCSQMCCIVLFCQSCTCSSLPVLYAFLMPHRHAHNKKGAHLECASHAISHMYAPHMFLQAHPKALRPSTALGGALAQPPPLQTPTPVLRGFLTQAPPDIKSTTGPHDLAGACSMCSASFCLCRECLCNCQIHLS